MNNNVLDHIWWNFTCEAQNGENNGGKMMYDYGLDHGELGEHFLVLTMIRLLNIRDRAISFGCVLPLIRSFLLIRLLKRIFLCLHPLIMINLTIRPFH